MARVRFLERKRKRKLADKKDRFSINITNDPGNNLKVPLIAVYLPLKECKKTVKVEENETPIEIVQKLFNKYYANLLPDGKAEDYLLKVAGLAELIYGPHPLLKFEHVRKCLAKNQKIELVLTDKKPYVKSMSTVDTESLLSSSFEESPTLLKDTAIQYNHSDICNKQLKWEQKSYISIWELEACFSVKVLGIDSLSTYCTAFEKISQQENYKLYVTAGLYHGGLLISDLQYTECAELSEYPRWHEEFSFNVAMRDLPRAVRICFSLYATTKSEKNTTKDVPIAWVNCQLINFQHKLLTGVQSFSMWRDAAANPIGTCVQNNVLNAPSLYIALPSYQLPAVFPTYPLFDHNTIDKASVMDLTKRVPKLDKLLSKDPLYPLSDNEKAFIWKHRYFCRQTPKSLPKLLASVPVASRLATQHMHRLLSNWEVLSPLDALELLDSRFADFKVREFAVKCLEDFSDSSLSAYLLQLIQVLKYEPYHDSALARFLLKRAFRSTRVGHSFFWYLKAEMHIPEICERYGLLLEAYLHGSGDHLYHLQKQNDMLNEFTSVAKMIKNIPTPVRKAKMIEQLKKIKFPDRFQLPLNPKMEASGLLYEKCKFMDSKKVPLWLVFKNADPVGNPIYVIFKEGDDLRQDMLTLQMIRIMDKVWKQNGLDLKLSPYECISTGDEVGMIEVVLNASTTAQITREGGGATAAFKQEPIANWLKSQNPSPSELSAAVERFVYSCAGYCVATYVLGIGDRHNDNIMLTKSGQLFHIDFGHFLGNFKKKFGLKRERAKFVLTPDFVYVMGGQKGEDFNKFIDLCCKAFNILRKSAHRFINLFAMMLSTGIPELTKASDIDYMRDAFFMELDEKSAASEFTKLIFSCLGTKTTQLNNAIHILAH